MTFPNALNTAVPANGDQVSEGAQRIRELAAAVRQRLTSLVVDVDVNPLRLAAGAIPSGYALTAPVISGGQMNNASFANPTFSGTITGISLAAPVSGLVTTVSLASTTALLVPNTTTVVLSQVLPAGTYLLVCNLRSNMALTTSGSASAQAIAEFFNLTGAAVISEINGPQYGWSSSAPVTMSFEDICGTAIVVLTTLSTIQLRYRTFWTGSWTSSNISVGGANRTQFSAIRIA